MTTWYKEDRGVDDGATWAFSVRPDLWPPGSHCWAEGSNWKNDTTLADWALDWTSGPTPDTQYSGPGAAEALILSGQVMHGTPWDKSAEAILGETRPAWSEILDPRGSP